MKLDNWIMKIVDQYLFYIGIGLLLLISIFMRAQLAPNCIAGDYWACIDPWFEAYKTGGGLKMLDTTIGNYYVPYNVILALLSYLPFEAWKSVAFVSCLFEYLTVYFIYKIIMELFGELHRKNEKKKAILFSVIMLFLPFTVMNGALWKQCDSIYVCFAVMSIYYMLKEKYGVSLIWFSVGFCFKIQILFVFPLYILLYFAHKKISVFQFLFIPLGYFLLGLPAIFAVRGIKATYLVYYTQINESSSMTLLFPNIYMFGFSDYSILGTCALWGTIAILIFTALYLQKYQDFFSKQNIVYLAIWCTWTCTMFLPAMHERYGYMTVLLISFYYLATDMRKAWIAIVMNVITALTYALYLFSAFDIPQIYCAVAQVCVYAIVTYDVFHNFKTRGTIIEEQTAV